MLVDLSWYDLAVIAVALAAGGFVKGISGIGMPIVAIPIMAGAVGIERAVLVLVIPGIVLNGWIAWQERKHRADTPEMPIILLAGCVGVFGGSWLLYIATERFLSIVLVLWIAVYIGMRMFTPDITLSAAIRGRLAPVIGMIAGLCQGSTGISAPVLATWMHSMKLRPDSYVYAITLPFMVLAMAQLVSYMSIGMYTPRLYLESMLAIVPALFAIPLGVRVRALINQQIFDWIVLLMISLIGVRLVYNVWVIS